MDNKKLLKLNNFINTAYECVTFTDFLKLSIMQMHDLVMYDSGLFFCAISKDSSFFKPYVNGNIESYYKKQSFSEKDEYLSQAEDAQFGKEAYVYKSADYSQGIIQVNEEPRSNFLSTQEKFYIVCIRIVYKGQFMGEIYLHRAKDKPDFSNEDMFLLQLLQPHVSTVFNIIHTITAVKYIETNNQINSKKGMCMLDGEMSLIGGNITALDMLKIPTVFGSSILYHIKELCTEIISNKEVKMNNNSVLRSSIHKTPNGDIRIDIFIKNSHKGNRDIQFVIVMELCDEEQITTDYKFKFTKREADIIDGLIQGKNNAQIAEALKLSENTIKTHIKNIYRKTGTGNRTELTYVLMLNRE